MWRSAGWLNRNLDFDDCIVPSIIKVWKNDKFLAHESCNRIAILLYPVPQLGIGFVSIFNGAYPYCGRRFFYRWQDARHNLIATGQTQGSFNAFIEQVSQLNVGILHTEIIAVYHDHKVTELFRPQTHG